MAVVAAERFEEGTASGRVQAVPLCRWRGEVVGGVLALLPGGLNGGDGFAVRAELGFESGAVVWVFWFG